MSVANRKTYQTSRMYYKSRDHKAIYMDGNFHHNIIITDENGNYDFTEDNRDKLAWHKSFDDDYVILPNKALVYPKYKICSLNNSTISYKNIRHQRNGFLGMKCGNDYYDSYGHEGASGVNITKLSKDGRILYKVLGDLGNGTLLPRNRSGFRYRLGNHISCNNGFLYSETTYDERAELWYNNIYFQKLNAGGTLGSSFFICDDSNFYTYKGRYKVQEVFALNNYIYVFYGIPERYSSGQTIPGQIHLDKISPEDGSVISTTSKIDYSELDLPDIHITNGGIFIIYRHGVNIGSQAHWYLEILDATFASVFSMEIAYSDISVSRVSLYYYKNNYYLYAPSRNGLAIYCGGYLSSLSLIKTIPYNTEYRLPDIGDNNEVKTVTISNNTQTWPAISKYFNYYKNRQLADIKDFDYIILNNVIWFDNAELEINDNSFYLNLSYGTGNYPQPTQEQIWDKYFNAQQGGN